MVGVFAIMFIGMIAGQVLTPVLEPPVRPLAQAVNKLLPTQIVDPAAAITLKRRDLIPKVEFDDFMVKAGFDNRMSDLLFQATQFFPSVQDGITFAVREVFREDIATLFELDTNFNLLPQEFFDKIGISRENLKLFWRAHWILPSIGQGFEMFQRLSGLQLPFKQEDLEQLGFDDKDIETNQFELETLLTTQDIMPAWQKRLLMIAFQPITRVDIRRFAELGLLDDADLEFRYREIGNSPADAKLQVKFIKGGRVLDEIKPALKAGSISPEDAVIRLDEVIENRQRAQEIVDLLMIGAKKSRTAKERDLTQSQILNAFEDGLFSEDDTLASLQTLGFDLQESQVVLQLRKNDIAAKELKATEKEKKITKAEVIRLYIGGQLSRNDAGDRLDSLGFNNDDIELLLLGADSKISRNATRESEKSKREEERQVKEQTKADTIKAFKAGTISEAKTIEELEEAKFSPEAIQIILDTAKKDLETKQEA